MILKINQYVTANDGKDPLKGNKTVYSLQVTTGGDVVDVTVKNYPDLTMLGLIKKILEELPEEGL
jgi:hypothetical protein